MKKLIAVLAVVTVTVMGLTGSASAQSGVLELDPASVDAPGEHEISVSLSNFSAEIALFVLPCAPPEGGDMANFDAATACDQSQLTPINMDADGAGQVSVTYDVGEGGIVVVAGDAARTEFGLAYLTVGEPALPETGAETGLIAVVAATMVAGGAMVVRQARRLD